MRKNSLVSLIFKNFNLKKADVYAEELYQFSIKENNRKHIAKALYCKAYIQKNLGNYARALNFIDTSVTISRDIDNDSLLLQNTNLLGIIFSDKGDYKEAIKHYLEARLIAERLGNLNDILVISRSIGIIKKQTADYVGALEVFSNNLKSIKVSKIENFKREHALNYFNIADTHLRMEDYKYAGVYTDSALQFVSKQRFSDLYNTIYANRAIIAFQQKKYKKSITICQELASEILETKNEKYLSTPYLYLGKSHFKLQDYDLAIIFFEKVKTIVSKHDITFPNLEEVYFYLVKSYINTNNKEKADINFDLLNAFDKKKDAINIDVNRKIYKEFDTANLKAELEILNVKNDQQQKKLMYLFSLAITLVIVFIGVYWKKQSINNQRFKVFLNTIEGLEKAKIEPIILPKKTVINVAPENVQQILKSLEKFEDSELFLKSQCNLVYVAKKLNTNTSYLSNVINTHKGQTFKSYLTELRINAALVQLKNNKQLRLYTIKALAEEFGFKRYETFSRAFKSQTGIYPSAYVKNLQKEKL